ncbi:uncharacterized protein LOC135352756 [Latimeria chalumnae]|uniref:uncharacterized protein LOC135352756 n=1 Tax=Latimeria chalumnae TaxID=7897 RepID=UPI00313C7281
MSSPALVASWVVAVVAASAVGITPGSAGRALHVELPSQQVNYNGFDKELVAVSTIVFCLINKAIRNLQGHSFVQKMGLLGSVDGLLVTVPSAPVIGVVGESVLLPVNFTTSHPPTFLQTKWEYVSGNAFVLMHITKCSFQSATTQRSCTEHFTSGPRYGPRVTVVSENASLHIHHARAEDAGKYRVTLTLPDQEEHGEVMLLMRNTTNLRAEDAGSYKVTPTLPKREEAREATSTVVTPTDTRANDGRSYKATPTLPEREESSEATLIMVTYTALRIPDPVKNMVVINITRFVFAGLVLCLLAFVVKTA